MSYFVPSALVAGQAKFTEKYSSGEWRLPDVAAFNVAQKSGVANPSLVELRTREDRSVYAYMPVRQAAIGGTARAHDHTGARGDSIQETITWSTFSEPFSISLKQADNNVIAWAEMYASTLQNAVFNLMTRANTWFAAALVAGKTQVNVGGGNGTFNATDDIYEVPLSEINYFFQNARRTLNQNLYKGMLMGIVDDTAATLGERLQAQGSANATNFGFQFAGMDIVPTTATLLGTGYSGSGLFWENGLVAVIPWIPKQNRKPLDGNKVTDYVGDYGSFTVPQLPGIPFAIHAYGARANASAAGGYTQDVVIEFEVSFDLGFVAAPLGTFRGSDDEVIYGIGQLSS
jgi:hypothetical protein